MAGGGQGLAPTVSLAARLVSTLYPLCDVLIVGVVARLLFSSSGHRTPVLFLAGGMLCLLAGDLASSWTCSVVPARRTPAGSCSPCSGCRCWSRPRKRRVSSLPCWPRPTGLTGLANRRTFDFELGRAMREALDAGRSLVIGEPAGVPNRRNLGG